ncbi:MAG: hypothetical protein WCG73_02620, partial [Candidatus Moraniibacteriota bacterium]
FTHGDEVSFNQTWGHVLEEALGQAGVNAEVLNFGVCGYGMDQAYLRWKKTGRFFSPDIVIFGFQTENMQRNLNIIRIFYCPNDDIFFSKPRFIMKGSNVELINTPCIEPQNILAIMRNLKTWDLVQYEYWALPSNYEQKLLHKSKLFCVMMNLLTKERTRDGCVGEFTRLDKEPVQLALKIVDMFKKDVEAAGSKFFVLYLPQTPTLGRFLAGTAPFEANILKKLDETGVVIHPERDLAQQLKKTPWRAGKFYHYSPEESNVLGQTVARYILEHRN